MSFAKVLVDTSVWIQFLKTGASPVDQVLQNLIASESVVITDIVLFEITYGAKDTHQFKKYLKHFSAIPFLNTSVGDQDQFCHFRFNLRTKGIITTYTDAMIAWIAIQNHCLLYTLDADFQQIARHTPLRLRS